MIEATARWKRDGRASKDDDGHPLSDDRQRPEYLAALGWRRSYAKRSNHVLIV